MRTQVILDSLFARPGSAPMWGGKKGEFRDWTSLGANREHIAQRGIDYYLCDTARSEVDNLKYYFLII